MAEKELNIKVKADPTELQKFRKEVKDAENEVLLASKGMGKFAGDTKAAGEALKIAQNNFAQAKATIKEFGNATKLSSAQLLEFGENLTVITAGVTAVFSGLFNLGKESVTLSAELNVLRSNFKGSEEDLELFRKATAGTVTDANLIKLSNQAGDLGISLDKQALFFSLAEDAADKYGGSVEDNFQKVVYATEGNIKGLKALGIQKEVYNKTVSDLVKSMGGEIEMLQGVNGEQELNIKKLDPAIQKQIRLEAILKLTGVTLDSVKSKTQDQKDKIEALSVRVEEAKVAFGDFVMKGVEPLITKFLDLGKTGNIVMGGVSQLGSSLGSLLPIMASLKLAFGGAMLVTLGQFGVAILNIAAHVKNIIGAWNILKAIVDEDERKKKQQEVAESWFGDLVGMDPTNHEKNKLAQTGFVEGVFNALNIGKNFARNISDKMKDPLKDLKLDTPTKGGRIKDLRDEKEAVEELSLGYDALAGKLTILYKDYANSPTGLGFIATSKKLPADLNTKAGLAERLPTFTEKFFGDREFALEIVNRIKDSLSGVGDTLKQITDVFNLQGNTFLNGLVSGFSRALQYVHLIVSALEAVNTIKSLFAIVSSFVPGGGAISAIGGGATAVHMPQTISGGGMRPMINVVVQSEVESAKAINFFETHYPNYQEYARKNSH